MTHMQSRVCKGSPDYVPSEYGSILVKKYVLSLEWQVKELCYVLCFLWWLRLWW